MDTYLLQTAKTSARRMFKSQPNRPQLQLSVIEKIDDGNGIQKARLRLCKQINDPRELEEVRSPAEFIRIYTVQHMRTWSTLDISFELFNRLLDVHQVFPAVWKVILTFGVKFWENEYAFPPPQRQILNSESTETEELAYVIRRVEENGRSAPQCPWSIRQTGVYQKAVKQKDGSGEASNVVFLVAPSINAERHAVDELEGGQRACVGSTFAIHRTVIAESLMGWMGYMCWLEEQLKLKETTIMAPPMHGDFENRAIGFLENSRHELKKLEDSITNMTVILDTKVRCIIRLKTSREKCCLVRCTRSAACACRQDIEEFDQYAEEAKLYQERAKVLQARVHSVQSLLSDILSYEEARTSKDLMVSAVKGNKAMEQLAIIGLVFMPITLVENFFSTEFVKDDGDKMHVSKYAWMLAAVAVPLTAWVIVFWRLWLRFEFSSVIRCLGRPFKRDKEKKEEGFFEV